MAKIRLECLYCGEVWTDTVWSEDMIQEKCGVCGEEKQIKAKQIDDEYGNDIFGYRFEEEKK